MTLYCPECNKAECFCSIEHYNKKHSYPSCNPKLYAAARQVEADLRQEDIEYVVRLFKGQWQGTDVRDRYLYDIKDGIYKFGPYLTKYSLREVCSKYEFIRCANKLGIEYTENIEKLSVWEKIVKWFKYGDKEYQGIDVNTRLDLNWMRVKQDILEGM